ncbi:amidase signature enzyme [Pisolithus thermaeus]|nr:amidase signature enzyme [Pisolithus croceorrhizus]KAI6139860.1 amidase signature enzyme [Pisolithus thermaeus]
MLFSYLAHRRACFDKRREREERIASLPRAYHEPLSPQEKRLLSRPISSIIHAVQTSSLSPVDVLLAYGKRAIQAQAQTNCLTEVMIGEAEKWARTAIRSGPLAGVPVSLKDMIGVKGYDSSLGYSAFTNAPVPNDAPIVRLLHDAGAIPFVKTNVPLTLYSYETTNDVFGVTENPHKRGYSPGGSSGGESALLAFGGSRIGIGTDVAGSVRVPSHYSGVYAIKSSTQRFPKTGSTATVPGQEGVAGVQSPMAKTLEDLETFWRAVFQMKPWDYDHSVINLPWREVHLPLDRPIRWGVLWDDGVVAPSPACLRALKMVTDVLARHGHEIVTLNSPRPYEGLQIASQLLFADGGKLFSKPFHTFETIPAGITTALRALRLPRFVKKIYAWYLRYIRRDPVYAGLVENFHEKTIQECYKLVAQREDYRVRWFTVWRSVQTRGSSGDNGVDFILTVPNALPAVPHGGMRHGWKACGYAVLFNVLDYSAGVMPITRVNKITDKLPSSFRARNAIERDNYSMYNAEAMDGLPVGVQVVGRRLDEERVLEGMKLIHGLMADAGLTYQGIPL